MDDYRDVEEKKLRRLEEALRKIRETIDESVLSDAALIAEISNIIDDALAPLPY